MALKTQGFAVSALPRAPQIPGNIGQIDVKEIYDGVRRGLAAVETARTAPASMILADAQMKAATEQAPLKTRQVLAQTEGVEQQTPLRTSILAQQAQNAADQAPLNRRVMEARAKEAEAQATPEFLRAKLDHLLLTMKPSGVREFDLLTAGLTADEKEHARRIHLGMDPRVSPAAIQYKEVMGADGVKRIVAVDPRGVGAHVVGSGETYGTGVGPLPRVSATPTAETSPTVGANQPPQPPNVFRSPTIADQAGQKASAEKTAENIADARSKLPKALSSLDTMEAKTSDVERDIDQAIALSNSLTTGYGAMLKNLPATDARKLEAILNTVRANIGFDALTEMRKNSPTGGALGNVSDYEGKTLQSTIASLDQALSASDLKEALIKVKEARRQALTRVRSAYERDIATFGELPKAGQGSVQPTAAGFKIIEVK